MFIKDFRNTKEFETYLLDNKTQKNIKLFYDIETLRYNEEGVYIDGYKYTHPPHYILMSQCHKI